MKKLVRRLNLFFAFLELKKEIAPKNNTILINNQNYGKNKKPLTPDRERSDQPDRLTPNFKINSYSKSSPLFHL